MPRADLVIKTTCILNSLVLDGINTYYLNICLCILEESVWPLFATKYAMSSEYYERIKAPMVSVDASV